MKRINFIYLLGIVFLTSSCSAYYVNSTEVSPEFYPSKKSAQEIVYIEKVDRPFEIVGYITVNAERSKRLQEVIENIKREAAILGADAITDIKSDASGNWKKLPAQHLIGNGYVRANFTATAVVFKQ